MNNTLHNRQFPLGIIHDDDKLIVITSQGTHYATTYDPSAARLIAAAPDLLQVAEDYVLLCQLHGLEGAVLDSALSAIAKAKGEA